ncbi:MAG: hypothetical protein WD689_05505 [Gaiellaceae bacterium]
MRPPRILLALAALSLVFATSAAAEIVHGQDAQGRTITYDVDVPGADVAWYTSVLSGALHGDEIAEVTIRIVSNSQVTEICGGGAAACYSGGFRGATIVVPAGKSDTIAAIVLHEYGHHIDANSSVSGLREPNGTPRWWAARGIAALVESGEVARDYRLGWDRSIGEIFAEDYVQAHMTAPFKIRWLSVPSVDILDAIRLDLAGAPAPEAPPEAAEPQRAPLVVTRSGRLRPGQSRELPFTLLGPGRRVTFTGTAAGRVRLQVVCDGAVVARTTLSRTKRTGTLDRAGLGPAECTARATNLAKTAQRFSIRLRLAVES